MQSTDTVIKQPSSSYKYASFVTLEIGAGGYLLGLWNADILLSEKGFYCAVFFIGAILCRCLTKKMCVTLRREFLLLVYSQLSIGLLCGGNRSVSDRAFSMCRCCSVKKASMGCHFC